MPSPPLSVLPVGLPLWWVRSEGSAEPAVAEPVVAAQEMAAQEMAEDRPPQDRTVRARVRTGR